MGELTMSRSQRETFLADVHIGVFTAARGGEEGPLAAPVWYSYRPGGDVIFSFESTSEKIRLLEATGRASLCAQNEAMPYKYVTVEGPVTIDDADAELERSLAYRYLGPHLGDMYLNAVAGTANRIIRLSPARWHTVDYTPFVGRVVTASAT
jgi:hypothetical protein